MNIRSSIKAFLAHISPPFRKGLGVGLLLLSLPLWGGLGWGSEWGCSLHAQQLHRYNPDFGLSAENFCDTICIEVEDDLILIPVQIGGKEYRFCLDTGSSQGMVYANNNISSLVPLGNIISRDANNHVDTVRVVQLPSFTFATQHTPLTISGYVASLMPRQSISAKYDAIIGFDLFNRGLCAKIDKERGMLILTDSKQYFQAEEAAGHTLRYKLKWFVPYLYVSPFVRHTDEALFDTGSAPLYTMSKQSFDEHLQNDLTPPTLLQKIFNPKAAYGKNANEVERQVEGRAEGHLSLGGFGLEKKDEVVFLHLDRLKWGDFAFTDLRTITTQGASKIGARLLDYGSVVINPFRKQITFLPYLAASDSLPTGEDWGGASSVTVGNKQFSVAFVPYRGQAVVGLIWEGSQPYKAGMRQGDIIQQIDQRPIATYADFLRFRFIKGESHRFRLLTREGTEKTVECIIKE